jgi:uncharacterized Zn finger protein
MGEVINIEDMIDLVCPGCDQAEFLLRKSRTVQCSQCGLVAPIQWFFTDEPTSDLEERKHVPF